VPSDGKPVKRLKTADDTAAKKGGTVVKKKGKQAASEVGRR